MNTEQLIGFLSGLTDLSPVFVNRLEENLKLEYYKTHQIIHAAGHLENRLYFLQSGFARNYYYDHHGNEHTEKFWETGDILFSFEGYYNVPSYFYTEILEECVLITLSYEKLHELDHDFPEISVVIKKILLSYQKQEYKKQEMISLSARDRYLQFRKNKPNTFQKIPIRIIASYLHMTRETLTRLIAKG